MTDIKQKLIELFFNATFGVNKQTIESYLPSSAIAEVADQLIANGVMVGKPLTEYLHPVDNYAGLKGKYLVFKADTGEQVTNCFVLRPDKDTAAVEALRAYARNTDNETLAEDIYNWVGKGEPAQGWISVKDRLPEDDSDVLAYLRIGEEGRIYPATYAKGVWFDCIFNTPATDSTTHWMPLPQPPKGE